MKNDAARKFLSGDTISLNESFILSDGTLVLLFEKVRIGIRYLGKQLPLTKRVSLPRRHFLFSLFFHL